MTGWLDAPETGFKTGLLCPSNSNGKKNSNGSIYKNEIVREYPTLVTACVHLWFPSLALNISNDITIVKCLFPMSRMECSIYPALSFVNKNVYESCRPTFALCMVSKVNTFCNKNSWCVWVHYYLPEKIRSPALLLACCHMTACVATIVLLLFVGCCFPLVPVSQTHTILM